MFTIIGCKNHQNMWNLWFIITFLTLPEMINLSSWLLSPSWTPLLFTSSPLARISWASGGMPVTSRLARTAWNRGEQRSKIIDLGKWWPYIMALIIMALMVSENHWIIHSPEMLGPFWDDSPYKNHDSRARENRVRSWWNLPRLMYSTWIPVFWDFLGGDLVGSIFVIPSVTFWMTLRKSLTRSPRLNWISKDNWPGWLTQNLPSRTAREERKFDGNSQEKLHDLLSLKCYALKDFIPQQARNLEKKAKAADQTPKSSPTGASWTITATCT